MKDRRGFIGDVIRELRLLKKMSQSKLAEDSSLHIKTIYNIEGNIQEPKLSTLYSLAEGLNVDFIMLMNCINQKDKN